MTERVCLNCIYLLKAVRLHSSRDMTEPQVILPLCMNHAETPGEVREVLPTECCRNFLGRREPANRPALPTPPSPDIKYIPLSRGQFAIVDAADYEWLKEHRWFLKGSGDHYYACRAQCGRTILMHREIMQPPEGMVVDHINHNPVNNRRCNLRVCTPQQNQHNRRPIRNKSGFIGVFPYGKRWKTEIRRGGKVVYREVFDDKIEAAKARDRKAIELFGPFAYLNFPDEVHSTQPCPCEGRCDSCPLAQDSTSAAADPLVEPDFGELSRAEPQTPSDSVESTPGEVKRVG